MTDSAGSHRQPAVSAVLPDSAGNLFRKWERPRPLSALGSVFPEIAGFCSGSTTKPSGSPANPWSIGAPRAVGRGRPQGPGPPSQLSLASGAQPSGLPLSCSVSQWAPRSPLLERPFLRTRSAVPHLVHRGASPATPAGCCPRGDVRGSPSSVALGPIFP